MKRALAIILSLCLLLGSAAAAEDAGETERGASKRRRYGLPRRFRGRHRTLQYKVEYPAFECEDQTLGIT
jgi:hypothetical protein